ncbi:MAG: beta-propeller domain-containing protein [Nocardioides sp.]|uniref:beta-propeller domain-containing protein n=1 Tax=Nocardioides sp. TaxID=35761 RepID=UPI003F0E88B1
MNAPRSSSPRRNPVRLVALGATATLALAGAFGTGWVLAERGGDRPTPTGPTTGADPIALAAGLRTDPSCDDLLASFVERGQRQVGPWGWSGNPDVVYEMGGAVPRDAMSRGAMPSTSRVTSNESGTNVQEVGVDEADVVKTRDDLLVRMDGRDLEVWDVGGAEPVERSSVTLEEHSAARIDDVNQLLLVGDTAVVVGVEPDEQVSGWVTTLDLSSPDEPTVVGTVEVQGSIDEIRLHGDVVRLVVNAGLPELDFVEPGLLRGERGAERRNREIVADSTIEDWLPTVDGELIGDCGDVAIPEDDTFLGSTVVAAFDPTDAGVAEEFADGSADGWSVAGVATTAASTYMSTDRLYLASGYRAVGDQTFRECFGCEPAGSGRTRIDAFALDGTSTTWVAGASLDGAVADRWSMDAVGGSLRVALGATSETGDFNSVVVLDERAGALEERSRVDHLGPGEEIKSVRWFDDLAIVVTFRQIDPLYAVDLSDPDSPRLLGELKIPGFSEYLHPLGSMRMVGLGQDGSRMGRGQAAVFDVTDLTDVRRLDVHTYAPATQMGAAGDPRQFTWMPEHRTVLTVVIKGWDRPTAYVSVLHLVDGELHNRMIEVEHGSDVSRVRTVPLADGRVALNTSSGVEFLDL